jgi:AMP-binding enzyme
VPPGAKTLKPATEAMLMMWPSFCFCMIGSTAANAMLNLLTQMPEAKSYDLSSLELVMACVVLKPGTAMSANDLTSHCRQFLANYKIPRRIEFSDTELPKSGSGKILKRTLSEQFWAHEQRAVG